MKLIDRLFGIPKEFDMKQAIKKAVSKVMSYGYDDAIGTHLYLGRYVTSAQMRRMKERAFNYKFK